MRGLSYHDWGCDLYTVAPTRPSPPGSSWDLAVRHQTEHPHEEEGFLLEAVVIDPPLWLT
jgi:hypothetical protein